MPVDLEMFLSANRPTLFGYSSFDNRFSLRSGYDDNDYSSSLSCPTNSFHSGTKSRRFGFLQSRQVFVPYEQQTNLKASGKNCSVEELDCTRKKKVSFADDKGLNLVEVREIPWLPKWTDEVLTLLVSNSQPSTHPVKSWKVASEHPPWEDEKILALLKNNKVVLESVSVKDSNFLKGSIKVKNLAFEKNVFLRITFDRWMSYVDIKAEYVKPKEKKNSKTSEYDTFNFFTKISSSAMRYGVIEFCVCFQCQGSEYWDNNGGINYRLITDTPKESSTSDHRSDRDKLSNNKITLSLTENMENFYEISAWSEFIYNQPYW